MTRVILFLATIVTVFALANASVPTGEKAAASSLQLQGWGKWKKKSSSHSKDSKSKSSSSKGSKNPKPTPAPKVCEPNLDRCESPKSNKALIKKYWAKYPRTPVCDVRVRTVCSCEAAETESVDAAPGRRLLGLKFKFGKIKKKVQKIKKKIKKVIRRRRGCPEGEVRVCRKVFKKEKIRCIRNDRLEKYLARHPEDHLGTALGVCDVDECAAGTHTCDANAECTNQAGCGWQPASFSCACKCGFIGDGTTCTECTEAPTLVGAPADVTLGCNDVIPAAATVTATGNCGAFPNEVVSVTFAETREDGACDNNYRIVRTWTASDCRGLTTSHTQTITVEDSTAPVISDVPADVTGVDCAEVPAAADVTVEDNCGSVSVDSADVVSNGANTRTIARTWTATDSCGNTASAAQTLTCNSPCANEGACATGFTCVTNWDLPEFFACEDINECDASPCGANAVCTNTEGSYECACAEGYEGDATTGCTEIPTGCADLGNQGAELYYNADSNLDNQGTEAAQYPTLTAAQGTAVYTDEATCPVAFKFSSSKTSWFPKVVTANHRYGFADLLALPTGWTVTMRFRLHPSVFTGGNTLHTLASAPRATAGTGWNFNLHRLSQGWRIKHQFNGCGTVDVNGGYDFTPADAGKWFEIAARVRRVGSGYYHDTFLNGVLIRQATRGACTRFSRPDTPQHMRFGMELEANNLERRFDGDLDDIRVFRTALTDAQIQSIQYGPSA